MSNRKPNPNKGLSALTPAQQLVAQTFFQATNGGPAYREALDSVEPPLGPIPHGKALRALPKVHPKVVV